MIELSIKNEGKRVRRVRELIQSAGNKMASVHFVKRSDGKKRKMSFRLHVKEPSYASKPTGKNFLKHKAQDSDNHQITVFDVNLVRYGKKGNMNGRGDWRCIPLENVTRVCVNGQIYRIKV